MLNYVSLSETLALEWSYHSISFSSSCSTRIQAIVIVVAATGVRVMFGEKNEGYERRCESKKSPAECHIKSD